VGVTVLYDRDCGFCRATIRALAAWDRAGALRPLPLQSAEAEALTPWMDAERRAASAHVVLPDGEVRSAGAVAAPVLRELPGGAPFAALAERLPTLTDRGYRLVSGNRARLSSLVPSRLKRRSG
jgi:predicted DCC family thiol-disulfide oxidoreductase YuxK